LFPLSLKRRWVKAVSPSPPERGPEMARKQAVRLCTRNRRFTPELVAQTFSNKFPYKWVPELDHHTAKDHLKIIENQPQRSGFID
jgi:putative IMPACT (imprinted ancient) family translation regulator